MASSAATTTPRSYHSSTPNSYYSAVGGVGAVPESSSSSSYSAAPMASSAAASTIPPPPPLGVAEEGYYADHHQQQQHQLATTTTTTIGGNIDGGGNNFPTTSTPYLQSRLLQLRERSQDLSSELTKKLATSRSGQSLLHIGPSLSTLPPDLSSLLDALGPLLKDVRAYEAENREELERLATRGKAVRRAVRRGRSAAECAEIYRELASAEEALRSDVGRRIAEDYGVGKSGGGKRRGGEGGGVGAQDGTGEGADSEDELDDLSDDEEDGDEELDHASSLERAAYTTLHLLQELRSSQAEVSAITRMGSGAASAAAVAAASGNANGGSNVLPSIDDADDADGAGIDGVVMEKSRFLMKLAPRIRRLESDTAKCLAGRLESLLARVRHLAEEDEDDENQNDFDGGRGERLEESARRRRSSRRSLLLTVASCLRGLALLGKGPDAESAFARVAIMPVLRAKLSVGRLDEGGSRGECAGLFSLLDDVAATVRRTYGPILRASEATFATDCDDHDDEDGSGRCGRVELDLVACGVWVPVATALTADPGIRMAVFSPGIANVLQANYSALDTFLSELAGNLLAAPPSSDGGGGSSSSSPSPGEEEEKTDRPGDFSRLYYDPDLGPARVERAQARLYAHPATVEYYRRWNLPIYYQLRFAEFCKRLDTALDLVRRDGWQADAFTGDEAEGKKLRETLGFELPVFLELYDALLGMWRANVFLRPLTHRFLRGAVQLVGRVLAFVKEGLEGEIEFGGSDRSGNVKRGGGAEEGDDDITTLEHVVDVPGYYWNERVEDIAVVTWELTILDTCMSHDYIDVVADTVCPPDRESRRSTHNSPAELDEVRLLASEALAESSREIPPLVSRSWNVLVVDVLASRCSAPLSAVRGVAATYRMTNRPPPSRASPFVSTVLQPLEEFDAAYASRTPPQIGDGWKVRVVGAVAEKYGVAVEELIATVKRTEDALKSRKTRRTMAGGMSDGEKVKLQLYLDHREFESHVVGLGVDAAGIEGLVKLRDLTKEAESLFLQAQEKK